MTEIGNDQIEEPKLSEEQIDEIADAMELRALAEKEPAFAKLLKPEQVVAMQTAGFFSKEDIRAASDEELIGVKSVGLAAVQTLRDWSSEDVEKGDAVARRFLALKDGDDSLDVRPGDVIPARFGAEEQVEKGKATWR